MEVIDSGRGISREFLKTKLFTPFSQQDSLATGTGLGLSIVRQIVNLLGGDIQVKSTVGVGTEVEVTLILERPVYNDTLDDMLGRPSPSSDTQEREATISLFNTVRTYTMGKTLAVCGLDEEVLSPLRESITRYAIDWFGMSVVSGNLRHATTPMADIALVHESPELIDYLQIAPPSDAVLSPPVVILCKNPARYQAYAVQADDGKILDFASKPYVLPASFDQMIKPL